MGGTRDWEAGGDLSDISNGPDLVRLAELQLTGDGGGDGHHQELCGQRIPAVLLGLNGEDEVGEEEGGEAGDGERHGDQVHTPNLLP